MSNDNSLHDRWARLRFSIIGPLFSAPPPPGELQAALAELAAKTWRHPISGAPLRFGISTIERWYYAARNAQDPVGALRPRLRHDAGKPRRFPESLRQALRTQYQAHPGWSYQLHYDNLAVVCAADPPLGPLPSYTTVRRYMKAQGLLKQPRLRDHLTRGAQTAAHRLQSLEVRSFEIAYVHGLWHIDFHHASRKVLTPSGTWVTPVLLGVLDDCSRLACHVQWYLEETAENLTHGLCQAFQKRALPRALMTDNGSAMLAEEVRQGLHDLGILHETTLPYSPYQNAKQEVFWAAVEGRLIAMLEGVKELTLDLLNEATQAWVEREYHRTLHSELGCTPLQRYLQGPDVGRDSPPSDILRHTFRAEIMRTQRRSDGTISLASRRFEIPSRYRHLQRVPIRYARWDLRSVDLVDARTPQIVCPLYPLDKSANANSLRRRLDPTANQTLDTPTLSSGVAPLLRKLMADYAATGLPPAYLPKHPDDDEKSRP
jgi:putative transposase